MPRLTPEQKAELRALRNAERIELIKSSVRCRWGLSDWEVSFPWWRDPAQVRVLMYADGKVNFVDGIFGGLTYVTTLLKSRPYFFVDFEITTAHRDRNNTGATLQGPRLLTDPDLNKLENFDVIWFFGFNGDLDSGLSPAELELLDAFMKPPKCGGVLVTGDHADLGKSIAGQIKRAGQMRRYPAPGDQGPGRNTTLEEGPDPNCIFEAGDESDDRPQTIRYERFPVLSLPGLNLYRPHPVLCGPEGPIDVLPDHLHEGEAIVPTSEKLGAEWPTRGDGHQERPFVIAWGKTKEPEAGDREFGVVSAYDGHTVDVGRIVADSSWHHWFDFNITGIPEGPPYYAGFDATPAGQAALKKIDAYFLNCGVWLAPPDKQAEMRRAAWWSIVWTGQIAELSPDAPLWHLGAEAISALRLRASSCAVTDWVLGSTAFNNEIPNPKLQKTLGQFQATNLSLEKYVAGGIIRQLMLKVGPSNRKLQSPSGPPSDELLQTTINEGVVEGLSALDSQLSSEAALFSNLLANNFRLK
jgi:hypothetical protein